MNRKHLNATDDYIKAVDIISALNAGEQIRLDVDNIPAFRKYISDLSIKEKKKYATRKNNNQLVVVRLW